MKNKNLKRRILEISHKHKLSHLGSCLTAVDIIADIYMNKNGDEPFILSSGHSGLALYVVLEDSDYKDNLAEKLLEKHGIHPNRDVENGIYCSTGSLGQGLPIAVGMALSDRSRLVHCLISDGEFTEGSIHEALRITNDLNLDNLKIYVNCNGYGAYSQIDPSYIMQQCSPFKNLSIQFVSTDVEYLPFLHGIQAHYHVMNDEDYKVAMEILSGE